MESEFKTQVSRDHYFNQYDSLQRFISYFYQIDEVKRNNPKSVLEIGVGNKTVSDYLKRTGVEVTTCDFDHSLEPDVVADARKLPFESDRFDLILACEILEHIPFSDFENALSELKRVSSETVILSVPYSCAFFEYIFSISVPFFSKIFNYKIKVPYFISRVEFGKTNNEHYWEMGTNGYSKIKIRRILKKHFKIDKEFSPVLNSHHYFFILKKF